MVMGNWDKTMLPQGLPFTKRPCQGDYFEITEELSYVVYVARKSVEITKRQLNVIKLYSVAWVSNR